MATLLFIASCIGIYFGSDWLLQRAEKYYGKKLPERELIFFFIILALGSLSFYLVRNLVFA